MIDEIVCVAMKTLNGKRRSNKLSGQKLWIFFSLSCLAKLNRPANQQQRQKHTLTPRFVGWKANKHTQNVVVSNVGEL